MSRATSSRPTRAGRGAGHNVSLLLFPGFTPTLARLLLPALRSTCVDLSLQISSESALDAGCRLLPLLFLSSAAQDARMHSVCFIKFAHSCIRAEPRTVWPAAPQSAPLEPSPWPAAPLLLSACSRHESARELRNQLKVSQNIYIYWHSDLCCTQQAELLVLGMRVTLVPKAPFCHLRRHGWKQSASCRTDAQKPTKCRNSHPTYRAPRAASLPPCVPENQCLLHAPAPR